MSTEKESALLTQLAEIKAWARARGGYEKSGCHASFFLRPEHLLDAVRLLLEAGWFLEDLSAADVAEGILVNYHLDRFDDAARVALRVITPHLEKRLPSIAGVYSGAEWHEREVWDFFGVVFTDNPNFKPLLLPDDLGQHPLLKQGEKASVYALLPQEQLVDSQ